MATINPYQSSASPAIPSAAPSLKRRVLRGLWYATIASSGLLLLALRGFIERTFYWGGGNTVTGETDAELLFYAMLTNPVWQSPATQTALIVSPAFILCLLWVRRHFA